jgi:hypothetical protein
MIKKILVASMLSILFSSYFLDESCKQIFQLSENIKEDIQRITKKLSEGRVQ